MHDATGGRWRLVDPSGIRIKRFDDEALVFNPLTWETHLLNGVAVRVLDELAAGPKAQAQLIEALWGGGAARPEADPIRGEIGRFLRELDRLGLVEAEREGR